MDEESKGARQFYQHSRSWYREAAKLDGEEFMIGIYHREGGTSGEFGLRERSIGQGKRAWRLEVFDDAWALLPQFSDLFKWLETAGEDVSASRIRAALVQMGIEDRTAETAPHGHGLISFPTCSGVGKVRSDGKTPPPTIQRRPDKEKRRWKS